MPLMTASLSFFQSHDDVEPSRIGRPRAWNVAAPSCVLHCCASEFGTLGMVPMSAYRACPHLSATIVLTHGMPWYFSRMSSSCGTEVARSVSAKWLKTRKLSTLASRMANASELVHGNGMPRIDVKTGPYRVQYSVWLTVDSLPSLPRTVTVTLR